MTAAKPGLGQLLMNNMLLLDYTESFFLTKFGTELSPDMFDAKNEKGMEAVLYVSYKAVHGKAVSIQNSIKWPVDHNYPNQFNKTISDWVKELAKHGKIPTALAANLQSCLRLASGQRTIALLLLLSGHALSHVHRHSSSLRHTDVKVPFIVKDEELHCSPVIAACLALEKRKNATLLAEFATLRNEAQATAKYISGKLSKYSDAVEQQSNIAANREELLLTRGLNQKILSIPEVEAIKEEQAEIWRDIISKGEKQKDLKQQIHKALGQEIHPFQIGVDIKEESNEGKDGEFRMIDLPNLLQRSSESLKDYAQILPDQEEVFRMERSGKEVVQLLYDPHQKASQDLLVQQTSRLEAQQKLAKEIKDLAASVGKAETRLHKATRSKLAKNFACHTFVSSKLDLQNLPFPEASTSKSFLPKQS